jgi:hypothetical protein
MDPFLAGSASHLWQPRVTIVAEVIYANIPRTPLTCFRVIDLRDVAFLLLLPSKEYKMTSIAIEVNGKEVKGIF